MKIKIGITERGDAGLNLAWEKAMDNFEINGAVLITKSITPKFHEAVLRQKKPIIIHCTCTGYGGTPMEPGAPRYKEQLNALGNLIMAGFPAERVVLRVDPIFPTEKGLKRVEEVLKYSHSMNLGIERFRISVVDEYRHVKQRYRERGWKPIYGNNFSASPEQLSKVIDTLVYIRELYGYKFEICAEDELYKQALNAGWKEGELFKVQGCISKEDILLMGLKASEEMTLNPQYRAGCHCLSCKTELLTCKGQCGNGCVYCYWK